MPSLFERLSLVGFKGRLYALVVISVLSSSVFAALVVYSIADGSRRLSAIHERQVDPMMALREMEGALKDVRFRLAGYLLDQLPPAGNRIHLENARKVVFESWQRFKDKTAVNEFGERESELIAQIDRHLGAVDDIFERMMRSYLEDDKEVLAVILEDEWPFAIHAALLKPIAQLVSDQGASVVAVYDASVEQGRYRIMLGIVILGVTTLTLAAFAAHLAAGLTRRLNKAAEVANRVAAGNWNCAIDETSRDEVGALVRTIGSMRDQVRSRQEWSRVSTPPHRGSSGTRLKRLSARTSPC